MERIACQKRLEYVKHSNAMNKRISDLCINAIEVISNIPHIDGTIWDQLALLKEWEIKKQHHLDAKDCEYNILQTSASS